MKRFSIGTTDPQYEKLLKWKKRLGLSLGELLRRIIDEWLEWKNKK